MKTNQLLYENKHEIISILDVYKQPHKCHMYTDSYKYGITPLFYSKIYITVLCLIALMLFVYKLVLAWSQFVILAQQFHTGL